MKGSTLEPTPGYAQHDDARFAFLDAVTRELPGAAFKELREQARREPDSDLDALEMWAKKWHVDTPFVRYAARESVDGERRHPGNWPSRFVVWRSHPLPEAWHHKMATLNQLPVEFRCLDEGVASGTMKVPDPRFGPPAFRVVGAPLERLLEQDHVLAPIATDPCRESPNAFIELARHHYQARAQVGEARRTHTRGAQTRSRARYRLAGAVSDPRGALFGDFARRQGYGRRRAKGRPPACRTARSSTPAASEGAAASLAQVIRTSSQKPSKSVFSPGRMA